jgi:gelsolin
LIHNIHFWLGLETTQDEAGTAAYKTVELDDCKFFFFVRSFNNFLILTHHIIVLDTYAVQHREVQRRESQLFKSYFKSLTYLQGGFASGFHHVEEEQEQPARLLRVHKPKQLEGSRTRNAVVISQVAMDYTSLNSGAVFVLDTGKDVIYQWQGQYANGIERAKAAEFITQLISERDGKGDMVIVGKAEANKACFFFILLIVL